MHDYPLRDLSALLQPAVTAEHADELVASAAQRCGITSDPMDFRDASRVFETLGAGRGLVGLAARLAHARLRMTHLRARLER